MRPRGRTLPLLCAWAAGAAAASAIGLADAAEKLTDHFARDWYYTEVVVFQRPGVGEIASEERLAQPATPLAHRLRSFRAPPEQRWPLDRLSRYTRAHLSFPFLDASRLDLFAAEPVDAVDAAWPEADEVEAGPAGVEPPAIEPQLEPDPLLDFLRDVAAFEATLAADSYRWLASDTFTLAAHARALADRAGYQVLLHGRWLQPVPPREAPEPLLIQTGPRYGDSFALEGTFDVTRGRYLHFGAHLLYTEPLLGRTPVDRALLPGPAARAERVAGAPPLSLDNLDSAGFMQLRENRRVSDEEISYFDHPKLGVLVSIRPVEPPPALVAAHRALEQDRDLQR